MGTHLLLTPQVMLQPSPLVYERWILGIRPLRVTLSSWLLRFIATEVRSAVGPCLKLLSASVGRSLMAHFGPLLVLQVLQDLLLQTDRVLLRVWHVGQGVPEILVRCLLLCSALLIYWRGSERQRWQIKSSGDVWSSSSAAWVKDSFLQRWLLSSFSLCLKVLDLLQSFATVLGSSQLSLLSFSLPLFLHHMKIIKE